MEPDRYSKELDDAPMPHSIFFTQMSHAIHGSFEVKNLGKAVSLDAYAYRRKMPPPSTSW